MFSLDSISTLDIAKNTLRGLRLYKDMVKKLGKRGKVLFHQSMDGTHSYLVEYFPEVGKEFAQEKAILVYDRIFGMKVEAKNILLVPKEHLLSGIKVYFDDNCVDLSFKNIENKLQN